MRRVAYILILMILAAFTARAQRAGENSFRQESVAHLTYFFFNRFQTSDGLSGNTVTCSVQDRDGFIWVGTNGGICRYDGSTFFNMGDVESRIQMRGVAEALFLDDEGLLWFSTSFGRGFYNTVTGEITRVDIADKIYVNNISQSGDGDIWFCSNDLYKYSKSNGSVTRYPSNGFRFISVTADQGGQIWCTGSDGRCLRYDGLIDKFILEPYSGLRILTGISGNRILASTSDGKVVVLDPRAESSTTVLQGLSASEGKGVSCLLERVPGEFWIGTHAGVFIYNEITGQLRTINHSDSEQLSISSDNVTSLSSDREGNIWVGTDYKGLNLWRNNHSAFLMFYPRNAVNSIKGRIISAVTASGNDLWVGTEEGELNRFSMENNMFYHYDLPGTRNKYQSILDEDGELWIATDGNGVIRFDPERNVVKRSYHFSHNHFYCLLKTSSGHILVSSDEGVFRYVPDRDSFEPVPDSGTYPVRALKEDSTGRIWVGTTGDGIVLLDSTLHKTGSLGHLLRVTSFFEDSSRRMWVTMEGGGLDIYDLVTLERTRRSKSSGLTSNITCSVIEDDEGMMWLSTASGLYMVDPSEYHISTSCFAGTQFESIGYTFGSVCKTSSSERIFMGTTDGLLCFVPSRMKLSDTNQSVHISSVTGWKDGRSTELVSPGRSASYSDRIRTTYKDVSALSINFSCLDYSNIVAPQYEYTFTSRDGVVSAVTMEQVLMLPNIAYGHHTFTVRLLGVSTPESVKTVSIYVRPPFFRSTVAKILFVLVCLSIILGICHIIIRSRKEKRLRQLDEFEMAKQKELYESMNSFFMNITHEIRTPLTLIKMPLDRIISTGKYREKDFQTIKANTDLLLSLTNQLLDIRKLEQREEKLEFTRQDMCEIVRATGARYATMYEDQHVSMIVSVPDTVINAMCARDSVQKIVSNLLSNALKYGSDTVTVSLVKKDDMAVVRVDSNGDRIPPSLNEKIFEKFFHGGKGTGLGLPLARTLAELHGGRLYLDVSRQDANSFVLELPLEHPESISLDKPDSGKESAVEMQYDDSKRSVLIVEDNMGFRLYLAEALSEEYNVHTAANGRAAIEILDADKVDLIVSDIMMPLMDGCELCNTVKSTMEYCHIPVILLTAAVGMDTRIETLHVGADGYIEKPFPIELLMANIANLFKNREIAYHQFSNSPLSQFSEIPINKIDEALMTKLNDVMIEKMSESSLCIDDLSSALNISNSTLYRKVKANTGMNVSEYIRVFRLKRAAELLASGQYRINEVADMVGFSSSTYFSTNFQKQFNTSPSAFVKSLGQKTKD